MNEGGGQETALAAPHNRHYTREGPDLQGLSQAPTQSFGTRKSVYSFASGVPASGFQS